MAKRKTHASLQSRRDGPFLHELQPVNPRLGSPQLLQVLDARTYSLAMAARLTGLHPKRVARWLEGYEYAYKVSAGPTRHGQQGPLVRRPATRGTTYASFLDLIDLLFVKEFLNCGISLQRIRVALREASELLDTDHFAMRTFFTDGHGIYLQLLDIGPAKASGILELMTGGQWVIAPVIQTLATRIDFHEQAGFAQRWHPRGRDGLIVVDPRISFGRPSIVGRGIATENVYDFYVGEQEQVEPVCRWMGLEAREVEAAVAFEQQMAA